MMKSSLSVRKSPEAADSGASDVVWRTHVGLVREINEDRVLAMPERGIFVLSDGMGGHLRGDMAAQAVVDGLAHAAWRGDCQQRIAIAIDTLDCVNRDLCAQAIARDLDAIMGATVAALVIAGENYGCLWAGDSRCYLMRDGKLERLTRDHSVAQRMIDRRLLDESDRNDHPQASVITRAIGVKSQLEIETAEGKTRSGDRFLLCSDGVSALLDDEEIAAALHCKENEQAADILINGVLSRGAPDNASLSIISIC